jgi:hypothetical protein
MAVSAPRTPSFRRASTVNNPTKSTCATGPSIQQDRFSYFDSRQPDSLHVTIVKACLVELKRTDAQNALSERFEVAFRVLGIIDLSESGNHSSMHRALRYERLALIQPQRLRWAVISVAANAPGSLWKRLRLISH